MPKKLKLLSFQTILSRKPQLFTRYGFVGLILLASLFSIGLRYWWLSLADFNEYTLDGYLMPTTHDAYHWLNTLEQIKKGNWGDFGIIESLLPLLSWVIAKGASVSPSSLAQNLPVVMSATIVVPMLLIGRSLNLIVVSFWAAILTVVSVGYFNRTIPGYFDTDMLNLVFPLFTIWLCQNFMVNTQHRWFVSAMFVSFLSLIWHPSSSGLQMSILAMTLLWVLVRKPKSVLIYILAGGVSLLWFGETLFHFFWDKVEVWGMRGEANKRQLFGLISEAQPSSFQELAVRVSGNTYLMVLGFVGYIALAWRYPVLIITLPVLILGLMAMWLGRRFTMYASPFIAFGLSYCMFQVSRLIRAHSASKSLLLLVVAGMAITSLYPSLSRSLDHALPRIISAADAKMLSNLKSRSPTDQIIFLSWLDYGYALKYYTGNGRTILDGGSRGNGPVLARLLVDASPSQVVEIANKIVADNALPCPSDAVDSHKSSPSGEACQSGYSTRQKRAVYLYIPNKTVEKLGVIVMMSQVLLDNNNQNRTPVYRLHENVRKDDQNRYYHDDLGVILDKRKGYYFDGNQTPVSIKEIIVVESLSHRKKRQTISFDPSSLYSAVLVEDQGYLIVADEKLMSSFIFDVFLVGNQNLQYSSRTAYTDHSSLFRIDLGQ